MHLALPFLSLVAVLALDPPGSQPPSVQIRWQGPSGYTLIRVEAGAFHMGSLDTETGREPDEARHEVRISRAFWLGEKEVTQALWKEIMGTEPFVASYQGLPLVGPDLPAQGLSWYDAVEFCNRLSVRDGLAPAYEVQGRRVSWRPASNGYRLPTEAEWEYAARAGTDRTYTGASGAGGLCGTANVADATARRRWPSWSGAIPCADGFAAAAPVGSLSPSPWGLYDMIGNVSEWVWDGYSAYAQGPVEDPRGPDDAYQRISRGGSWATNGTFSRLAQRGRLSPDTADMSHGLRLARNLDP
jgi:formylglycine-generating enzyme required for sulfatase activity